MPAPFTGSISSKILACAAMASVALISCGCAVNNLEAQEVPPETMQLDTSADAAKTVQGDKAGNPADVLGSQITVAGKAVVFGIDSVEDILEVLGEGAEYSNFVMESGTRDAADGMDSVEVEYGTPDDGKTDRETITSPTITAGSRLSFDFSIDGGKGHGTITAANPSRVDSSAADCDLERITYSGMGDSIAFGGDNARQQGSRYHLGLRGSRHRIR